MRTSLNRPFARSDDLVSSNPARHPSTPSMNTSNQSDEDRVQAAVVEDRARYRERSKLAVAGGAATPERGTAARRGDV
jgi:hypothetical protein